MLSLLKKSHPQERTEENLEIAKDLFMAGKFPVVTTRDIPAKSIKRVIGLAAYRGYDMEQAFYGMITRAISNGANAVIGYRENVAFHPDGSKYISCYGTAVRQVDEKK
ncbi:heavy metal-binding domain-containing protein [Desulfobaculum bizertense]|uniref:Putative heavy-metal-binding n=1 Tax=Desulfobaculum bizertense DSM 18034 TaxID=1121442 RepID=A0A1T4W9A6_9BACT|nr:heavy metal-binding domain-containing protein [Desulfobaculum bizertense]UIJ39201.1 heavy metal-binding domain-containing protein [Desulfobaculum bizertense]SKA73628.1 Putative heavy-metal-binding [Desulfobaculum bizertense DSM 18034]